MLRLLIVDDEEIITDSLFDVFQNHPELSQELDVYRYYSSQEALDFLSGSRVDILLSDIRMPGLSGLELVKTARAHWPHLQVVLLTGFSDFDAVYAANKLENVQYLLKTEGYTKVIQAIENAVEQIFRRIKTDEILSRAHQQIELTQAFLQRDYFIGLLKGLLISTEVTQAQLNELGIALKAELPALLLIGNINNRDHAISYHDRMNHLASVEEIAKEYFAGKAVSLFSFDDNLYLIWALQILPAETSSSPQPPPPDWLSLHNFVKENLEMIQDSCRRLLGLSISFALDDHPYQWASIPDRFLSLKMLLNYRIGTGDEALIPDQNLIDQQMQSLSTQSREGVRQIQLDALRDSLENGNEVHFREIFQQVCDRLLSSSSFHSGPARETYYAVALLLFSHINLWNLTEKVAQQAELYKLMLLDEMETWPHAVQYLDHIVSVLFMVMNTEQEERAVEAVSRIRQQIQDHIGDPDAVTLVRLAEIVHFNPSYLSRLFRQLSGDTITDYICRTRIEKSKLLLQEGKQKINEIAMHVGFSTPTNFARFFKKHTGITPQQYKGEL